MVTSGYAQCCHEAARLSAEFNLCPQCERPLVRCTACGELCSAEDHCARCFAPEARLDLGTSCHVGDALALPLRLTNRGQRQARLVRLRYGLSCGRAFEHEKTFDRGLEPGASTELLLDGMGVERSGLQVLGVELEVDVDGKSRLVYGGECLLRPAREAQTPAGQVNIQIEHVDKAADVRIDLGRTAAEAQDEEGGPVPFELESRLPEDSDGVSRRTELLVPDWQSGAACRYFFAARARLGFGVARPAKHPATDVCIRLHPAREGRNLEYNETMSRTHFHVHAAVGRLWLTDCSTNGTTVNGRRVPARTAWPLRDGDRIAPVVDPHLIRHRRYRLHFIVDEGRVRAVEWIPEGES